MKNLYVVTFILLSIGFFTFEIAQTPPTIIQSTAYSSVKEIFLTTSQTYTLTNAPLLSNDVYVNGLLMLEGTDYTITGKILTFSKGQIIGLKPVIQVRYWIVK